MTNILFFQSILSFRRNLNDKKKCSLKHGYLDTYSMTKNCIGHSEESQQRRYDIEYLELNRHS